MQAIEKKTEFPRCEYDVLTSRLFKLLEKRKNIDGMLVYGN